MADNTPNFLGSTTPSETQPSFYYGYFSGLTPVEKDNNQQVVRFALPDLHNAGLEEQRRRAEYDTLKLYGVVDRNDQSLKRTATVDGMSIDTFVGMRTGLGISETDKEYSWYNPIGWYNPDTANRETIGEQEKNRQVIAGSGVRGMFGETNREYNQNSVRLGNSQYESYPWDANTAYDWGKENLLGSFGSWMTGFGKQVGWIDTFDEDADYWNLENKLKAEAPNWNSEVAYSFTTKFISDHPELTKYLEASGVDIHDFTRLSKNPFAWVFQVNQAVLQAQANRRLKIYEENTNLFTSTIDDLYYGLKDPTTARDMLVASLASYGVGGLEVGLGRLATTGFAARTGTAGALRLGERLTGTLLTRGLSGGPMTGPIESLVFNTSKTLVPSIGHNGFATATARALAIAAEGATWSSVSNMQMQKEEYRYKHLALNFGPFVDEFKYDTEEIFKAGLVGGAIGTGFFGTVRASLGALGDIQAVRAAKPGERLATLSRNIANSLDGYATTPEGRTIFGGKYTEGRAIAFGDWIDSKMQGIDNRNTAGVIVNGKQLHHFTGFTPTVIGKTNFNEAKAREIVSLWQKTTNIAQVPEALYDPEILAITGRTYDDVISTLKNYSNVRDQGLKLISGKKIGLFEAVRPYDKFKDRLISKESADIETEIYRKAIVDSAQRTKKLEEEREKKLARKNQLEIEVQNREARFKKETVDEFNRVQEEIARLNRELETSVRDEGQALAKEKEMKERESKIVELQAKYDSLPSTDPNKNKLKKKIQKLKKENALDSKELDRSTPLARDEIRVNLEENKKKLSEVKEKMGLDISGTDTELNLDAIIKERDSIISEINGINKGIDEDTKAIRKNEELSLIHI